MRKLFVSTFLTFAFAASTAYGEISVSITGKEPEVVLQGEASISAEDLPGMEGTTAEIHGNTVQFKNKAGAVVLEGAILKPQLGRDSFTGYVALQKGSAMVTVDDPNIEELIDVEGQGLVNGRITEISSESVTIGDKKFPLGKIGRLCSPRILQFACALKPKKEEEYNFQANATKISFKPTTTRMTEKEAKESKLAGLIKRCCKLPPLPPPPPPPKKGKGKGKGAGHHTIHIYLP